MPDKENWMSFLTDLSIRAKVIGAFCLLLVVTAALGAFAIQRLGLVNDGAVEIANDSLVSANALGEFDGATSRFRQLQASHLMAKAVEEKSMTEIMDRIHAALATYQATIDPGEERTLADDMIARWNAYVAMNDNFLQISRSGDTGTAIQFYTADMRTAMDAFRAALAKDKDYQVRSGHKTLLDINATYANAWYLILGALVFAGLMCVVAGYFLIGMVSTPIRRITDTMGKLAMHDLAAVVDGAGRKDEIGRMAAAVQVFKDSMLEGDRLKAAQEEAQKKTVERTRRMDDITRAFEASVGGVVDNVASQATQMESSRPAAAAGRIVHGLPHRRARQLPAQMRSEPDEDDRLHRADHQQHARQHHRPSGELQPRHRRHVAEPLGRALSQDRAADPLLSHGDRRGALRPQRQDERLDAHLPGAGVRRTGAPRRLHHVRHAPGHRADRRHRRRPPGAR
ncbi:MAG TPA: MCP four helix bundle domain-containing protein [Rhizomicrobium sp.]|jgi:HAMP domain-containing protein|nr:MCP four helix bundle domain-containing protein [Rhizomicrobium sp.]